MLLANFHIRVALKLRTDSRGIKESTVLRRWVPWRRLCVSCRIGCIVTPAITPQSEDVERTVAIFWLLIPNVRDLPIYALL